MSDLFASRKVMRSYLNALLTEEQETAPVAVQKQQLNKLLADVKPQADIAAKTTDHTVVVAKKADVLKVEKPVVPVTPSPVVRVDVPPPAAPVRVEKDYRKGKFQALFFEVAGLKVALPLKELGGIHQLGTLNTLPGKPDWYKGVMLYRDQKLMS